MQDDEAFAIVLHPSSSLVEETTDDAPIVPTDVIIVTNWKLCEVGICIVVNVVFFFPIVRGATLIWIVDGGRGIIPTCRR